MRVTRLFAALPLLLGASVIAEPYPEWTLHTGLGLTQTHLVDLDGNTVKTWNSAYPPGNSVYLHDDGSILRTARDTTGPGPSGGGVGGRIQIINWDGTLEWDYFLAGDDHRGHHDVRLLPNGNYLAIVWERMSAAEAIAMGRDPATVGSEVFSEGIYEIQQTGPTTGDVVWEWHVWDHLIQDFNPGLPNFGDPADHPEKIDINFIPNGSNPDWLHFNGLDYNPELDQVIISCHAFDELWIFSRDEASSGDLLYRWGNPQAYGRGTPADQKFFNQHNAQWIDEGLPGAGNILVYNNGNGRPAGNFSSIEEITPPLNPDGTYSLVPAQAYGPAAPTWICDNAGGSSFYSSFISGAQRLPNGNTLVCVGASGEFIELASDCSIEWDYVAGGSQFRATRIGARDHRLQGLLWCTADLAEPYETLDFSDVVAFLTAFAEQDPTADLAAPTGTFDFSDVVEFLGAFAAGCP